MAITRAEFLRLLPAAVGHEPCQVHGDVVTAAGEPPAWRIEIAERAGRAFGPVALPVLTVRLTLDGASAEEARAFERRFLLAYQRAGG